MPFSRGKKRGGGKGIKMRSNFGSREELDNPNPPKSNYENNFNTRTRPSRAQAMLARIQDKPPGTML